MKKLTLCLNPIVTIIGLLAFCRIALSALEIWPLGLHTGVLLLVLLGACAAYMSFAVNIEFNCNGKTYR